VTVYPAYTPSYASRSSYITADEYRASATGVNVSQLVPRGTPQENADALNIAIARASSYADTICRQILAATRDVESGRYRVARTSYVKVPTRFSPIVAVNTINVGFAPSTLAPITDYSNVWVDRKTVTIPMAPAILPAINSALMADGRVYVTLEYVNGYANTLSTAPTAAGDTTVAVASTLGIVPGLELAIYDPSATEHMIVESIDETAKTVTFTTPLAFDHAAGVSVSALPPAIKQAVVLLTSALIKTRGSEAIVMQQLNSQPSSTTKIEGGGLQEVEIAKELLRPFVRSI
jgi:hypothetical protein